MDKGKPLISVNLPTYNGEATIRDALESVKRQNYKNYEIVIVDHYSKDRTIDIAKEYTKKIYFDKGRLLSSRKIGLQKSKGELILFLSCDQILSPGAFERIAKEFNEKDIDMAVTEERSHNPKTWVEKMTDIDRKIVHEEFIIDPCKSVLLPSVFKKELLMKFYHKFGQKLLDTVTIHDHAITYYEAWKISQKVGVVRNVYYHQEPKSMRELFSHYVSWGKRSHAVDGILSKEYDEMFKSKMRYRLKNIKISKDSLYRAPIILAKGLGFSIGRHMPQKK
ncbi:MAG: glycosyltransferase family 2 protein [Nanoarchaeota archaeon]